MVAVEVDGVDLADADAGDPDLVVGLEAAGLGEGGVVGVAAADQRQVVGLEGDAGSAPTMTARLTAPIDDGVALAEGNAHPRSHLARRWCW